MDESSQIKLVSEPFDHCKCVDHGEDVETVVCRTLSLNNSEYGAAGIAQLRLLRSHIVVEAGGFSLVCSMFSHLVLKGLRFAPTSQRHASVLNCQSG